MGQLTDSLVRELAVLKNKSVTKMLINLIFLGVLLGFGEAKICWEECEANSVVQTTDIIGCHRRSTYPDQDFRCDGSDGPPCTVERGDTVLLNVTWANPGIKNMTQSTVWVTWMELPWVGMETEGCGYLDQGTGCRQNSQARLSSFEFPIYIQEIYPTGKYDLKWKFWERTETGEEKEVACFLFTIKIV